MDILGSIIGEFLKRRTKKILHYVNNPIEVQNELLLRILDQAKSTEIGKKFDFQSIDAYETYVNRVPILDYEHYFPYIDKIIKGEQNVLWPSKIQWIAQSSGTTNDRSKFIPVSQESLDECHVRGPRDLICIFARNNPQTTIFKGRTLIMGGSQKVHEFNSKIRYGDVSAILMSNQPPAVKYFRTPSLEIALMENWEQKIEQMALETMNQNVTVLAGVPTWTLVLIQRILKEKGLTNLKDVWPKLDLYIHGGVNFEPYKASFIELLGQDNFNFYQTYNASEGFFAYQYENGVDDMMLALNNGVFYEFIPEGHFNDENPIAIPLQEVEIGKNYAMVISTNAGLWRYKIGDTVRFTSKYPFKIKISGRTKHYINAFGEEVIIDNAEFAITEACRKANAHVKEFTVAPIYFEGYQKAAHEWLIEFENPPADYDYFMHELDTALQACNSDYEAKRKNDMALKIPKLTVARKGLFHDLLKKKGKLGGQHKVVRLSNDRIFITSALELNN